MTLVINRENMQAISRFGREILCDGHVMTAGIKTDKVLCGSVSAYDGHVILCNLAGEL